MLDTMKNVFNNRLSADLIAIPVRFSINLSLFCFFRRIIIYFVNELGHFDAFHH